MAVLVRVQLNSGERRRGSIDSTMGQPIFIICSIFFGKSKLPVLDEEFHHVTIFHKWKSTYKGVNTY